MRRRKATHGAPRPATARWGETAACGHPVETGDRVAIRGTGADEQVGLCARCVERVEAAVEAAVRRDLGRRI